MEAACAEADSNAQVANSPARRATVGEQVTRFCDRRRSGRPSWLQCSHRPAARLGELGRYGAFSVWRAWGGRKPRRGKASQGTYIRWRGVSLDGADLRAPLSGVLAFAGGERAGLRRVCGASKEKPQRERPVWSAIRGRGLYVRRAKGRALGIHCGCADGRVQPGTGRFGECLSLRIDSDYIRGRKENEPHSTNVRFAIVKAAAAM